MITCQGELSLENDVWCSPPQLLHNPMKLLQFLKRQEKKREQRHKEPGIIYCPGGSVVADRV